MKYDGYKLHQNIILTKTVEKYLEDDFEELIELFLKYLNDEYIEIYNELYKEHSVFLNSK